MSQNLAGHSDKGYALKNLYLDPNNYRFVDKNDYAACDDEKVSEKNVQHRTSELLKGKNNTNINDLIFSFKQNGYVPVDQIQVRKIGHQKYLVIEGNRRVAALKALEAMYNDSQDIGKLDPSIFKKVPVVDYEGNDPAMFKVLMGLKHISGNKKWPAINQAKLLSSLYEEHNMSEEDIYKSLGISKIEMRTTRRTLSLIKRYEESDFGDQFSSDKYSTFREIIKNPKIKDWLDLSPTDYEISDVNEANLYRLFSWISETEEEIEDDDLDSGEYQVVVKEPIIETALQVRELGKIISDPKAINNLEATRSLIDATLSSETLGKNKLDNALSLIRDQINVSFNYSYLLDDEKSESISESIKKLQALLVTRSKGSLIDISSSFDKKPVVESCNSHFSSFHIGSFKKFYDLKVNGLNKVNIFAGVNNAGKSSILELVYIVTRLGDTKDIQAVNKHRNKSGVKVSNRTTFEHLPEFISVNAIFNGKEIVVSSNSSTEVEIDNKSGFIGRLLSDTTYLDNKFHYHSDFYDDKTRYHATSNSTLCNSVVSFSSSIDEEEVFKNCYKKAVSNGAKSRVINFIRENIESEIKDIELSDSEGNFVVTYDNSSRNMDLSQYGDGLQKVFYLGIKFAACSNGVLLLDEVENGIHKDLLTKFTKLIQEMSEIYNVQVFVTSHSKECIDSFVNNGYGNDRISAYAFSQNENGLEYFSGGELKELMEYINIDIRGANK